jgi:hypothetical protein
LPGVVRDGTGCPRSGLTFVKVERRTKPRKHADDCWGRLWSWPAAYDGSGRGHTDFAYPCVRPRYFVMAISNIRFAAKPAPPLDHGITCGGY